MALLIIHILDTEQKVFSETFLVKIQKLLAEKKSSSKKQYDGYNQAPKKIWGVLGNFKENPHHENTGCGLEILCTKTNTF